MTIVRTFTTGADTYTANINDSYDLTFLAGDDRLTILAGEVTARMGLGNDYVRIASNNALIYGDQGADRFDIYASDLRVLGGSEGDAFNIFGGTDHTLYGQSGNDVFKFLTNTTDAWLSGGTGDDLFLGYGRNLDADIYGGDGNDRFYDFVNSGANDVVLRGGLGNDLYRINSASGPTVIEFGGEGTDTVQLAQGLDYTLGANLENLKVNPTAGSPVNFVALTGNSLNNRIIGGEAAETLSGRAGNDTLFGGGSFDDIYGGDGNDRITGGADWDYLVGGLGRDTFVYISAEDALAPSPWDYGSEFIADWEAIDRIDLSAIDADTTTPGHQTFKVDVSYGTPVTKTTAGWVTLAGFGGELYVVGHTDNDGEADFVIALWSEEGESALTPANLILT